MVPEVSDSVTEEAVTAPKLAVPESARVSEPPPVMAPVVRAPALPALSDRALPWPVTLPSARVAPEAEPWVLSVAAADRVRSPSVMALSVVATVPAIARVWPAALAVRPPANSKLSEASSPSVKLPVLLKVVLPAMLFAEPVIDTL